MRTIDRTTAFKRDFKREFKGQHQDALLRDLPNIIDQLALDKPFAPKHRDNLFPSALSSSWASYRACHIMPDLLLIYRKIDSDVMQLARLGSHSDHFG